MLQNNGKYKIVTIVHKKKKEIRTDRGRDRKKRVKSFDCSY